MPAAWADAVDEAEAEHAGGQRRRAGEAWSRRSWSPWAAWTATACPSPPSSTHVDGQFEQGAAAYEKRGVAVYRARRGMPTKCIQCNQCAYVCPHATIRPFALTEEEAKNAPAAAKIVDIKAGKGKGVYKFTMAISPLDCMGCGVCVGSLPRQAP